MDHLHLQEKQMVMDYLMPIYLLQLVGFGGAGFTLNALPKEISMHVKVWQVVLLCVPGIGILAGLIMLFRYLLK